MYDAYAGMVLLYGLRRLASREDAQDAVIDVFTVIWRRIEDVPDQPLPWIVGVARRVVAYQLRSDRSRAALVEKLALFRSGEEGRHEDAAPGISGDMLRALHALGEWEREALLLLHWEGLANRDAASVMGCAVPVFTLRVHRARRRLARALDLSVATPLLAHRATSEEGR